MKYMNNLGLLVMFISAGGMLVALADLFGRILPAIILMIPNLTGLLVGYWIYTQPTNRKQEERSKS